MLTKEKIIESIEQHKESIRSFGVKRLALFGSYANDKAGKQSDIDFLVEFEQGRGLFDDYTHLLHLLRELFGTEIDLIKPSVVRDELKASILEGTQIEAQI